MNKDHLYGITPVCFDCRAWELAIDVQSCFVDTICQHPSFRDVEIVLSKNAGVGYIVFGTCTMSPGITTRKRLGIRKFQGT